ncbi:pantetheine-phosphate adenylyltransferase [Chloroflexota bacterium]
MTKAIYPGSFDPVTNGHIDIVTRASKLFDRVIIGVFSVPNKNLLFSSEERVEMVKRAVNHLPKVEVETFNGLTVTFAKQVDAQVMVRGLRMAGDFEFEFEMAMMNKKLDPYLELVCFMARQEYQFLSSTLLKEVVLLNGESSDLVPEFVAKAIKEKVALRQNSND